MTLNWQQNDWPKFSFDAERLDPLEKCFLLHAGEVVGAFRHVGADDRDVLTIEIIADEALKTSEIEGELLDRSNVQSSLREHLGLETSERRVQPRERGIAELMAAVYQGFVEPIDHQTLFAWHRMVMSGSRRIDVIGGYRRHADPMRVISGPVGRPRIHFEAPPSQDVEAEMDGFVSWFNDTAPTGKTPLPSLVRAGIAHLYFESIHPFEDGNGRIGRALSEMALAQSLGQPSLIALAFTIEQDRNAYYTMLERSNKDNEITQWLVYFAETVLDAQKNTLDRIAFHLSKTRFYDRLRGQLNLRQDKVIARMLREGRDGFRGGLSAENYITIAKTSRATATRDLRNLVAKGALDRTGERRYTRYRLDLSA